VNDHERSNAPGDTGARAAVDVGTNTMRLLVVDDDGATLVRLLRMVRLGEGVDASGALADAAIDRAVAAHTDFRDVWRRLGVRDAAVVLGATSAVRDARDRDRFLDAVRAVAPDVDVRVLSGEEEAEGAFRGVASSLPDAPRPLVVLDVGGGSTELVVGDVEDRIVASTSLQLGSVRLTERLMPSDPPAAAEVLGAIAEVRAQLERAAEALGDPLARARTLVGVAGTVTTIAAVRLGTGEWQDGAVHGVVLDADDVLAVSNDLVVADRAAIAGLPEVQAGREDVIAAGSLIVRGVLDVLRHDHLVVSEADGLDGLLAR
jgi:exopolyphosphatase/guanosine-5'-triphosphate,3'-diphosphate pyrophosphatase